MKYLFATDLHGSRTAVEGVLARMTAEKADRLILLGDLLYHGPRNDLPEGHAFSIAACTASSRSHSCGRMVVYTRYNVACMAIIRFENSSCVIGFLRTHPDLIP